MLNRSHHTRLALESLEDRDCPSLSTFVDSQSLAMQLNSMQQPAATTLMDVSDTAESGSRTFQDRSYFFRVRSAP